MRGTYLKMGVFYQFLQAAAPVEKLGPATGLESSVWALRLPQSRRDHLIPEVLANKEPQALLYATFTLPWWFLTVVL